MPALLAALAAVPLYAPQPLLPVEDAYPHATKDRIVFQSTRAGGVHLFVSKLDGSEVRQITSGPREDRTPKWSPDGRHIVFAGSLDGNEDVWIVDADGGNARNVSRNPAGDSHPSWSPDGKRIVFCSTRGDGENDDIYVMDADGKGLVRLTDNGLDWDTFPSFSPDGRRIAFRRLLRQRTPAGTLVNSEVMSMNADGSDPVNLSKNAFFDGWPAWSPDGRRIAFASNRSDTFQLYVMDADGSNVVQAVAGGHTDVRPQWLADGSGLVFNREHDGRIELMTVTLPSG